MLPLPRGGASQGRLPQLARSGCRKGPGPLLALATECAVPLGALIDYHLLANAIGVRPLCPAQSTLNSPLSLAPALQTASDGASPFGARLPTRSTTVVCWPG